MKKKKTYFISDAHLGADAEISSRERELMLVNWLDTVSSDAESIYFLGDIFDHWFEYKEVIPRGFSLFLGKLGELSRKGIPMYFFTGNHDMWMQDYFTKEFSIPIIRKALVSEIGGKRFYLCHGDGLPNENISNKVMKALFSNGLLQWTFARFHPNFALWLMKIFSRKSRQAHASYDRIFIKDNEKMIDYAEMLSSSRELDYIIMGHRHLPIDLLMGNNSTRYVNLGDWVRHFSYAEFDGSDLQIKFFKGEHQIYPI